MRLRVRACVLVRLFRTGSWYEASPSARDGRLLDVLIRTAVSVCDATRLSVQYTRTCRRGTNTGVLLDTGGQRLFVKTSTLAAGGASMPGTVNDATLILAWRTYVVAHTLSDVHPLDAAELCYDHSQRHR